jgi:phosphoenolpyruvate carboxylase
MDLVEMVLAKADPRIAIMYDRALVGKELWPLGEEIRKRWVDQVQLSVTSRVNAIGKASDGGRVRD